MSLWWARREQLDDHQVSLIEELPLRQSHLILGPPGSGKTNVLLRRAQFVRSQEMPNVMVLTFTRSLTEFVGPGCYDAQGREIFPRSHVTTLEAWIRWLYTQHEQPLPDERRGLVEWKRGLAAGALRFAPGLRLPPYDTLFVDEAQDLMPEEVELLAGWGQSLFFVGDSRQRIYEQSQGLEAVRQLVPRPHEETLPFHYRLAPELCQMADRILPAQGGEGLASTSHYQGPKPGWIAIIGPCAKDVILEQAAEKLRDQIRAYGDLIQAGDRLALIVARKEDRELVFDFLENDPELQQKSQIIRARTGEQDDRDYNPAFDPDTPICIVTVQGCKGLEFRAVHWLFCDELKKFHNLEHYYTVVTRAKTSLDIYYVRELPQALSRAYSPPRDQLW
jgi:hypothetical protein